MRRAVLIVPLLLSACAPDQVGQRVGQSLYDASVSTGHALTTLGDRTGAALQDAGAGLRSAVDPPPPADGAPLGLPPPYTPEGDPLPAPVTAVPLGPPGS